jgi:hypothetical protein
MEEGNPMNLSEIERDARALMTLHGVGSLTFEFDNARRRLGVCKSRIINKGTSQEVWIPHTISISKHYAVLLRPDEIHDLMLHEIAHALAPGDGHGPKWKMKARALGIKGDRCVAPSASPESPITSKCPECDATGKHHRLPRALYVCKVHRNKAFIYYRDGKRVPFSSMPDLYQQRVNRAMERGLLR